MEKDRVFMDLARPYGMLKALALTLRLKEHSLLYGGVPCNAFIFISSSGHKRTISNPWGDESRHFVWLSNMLGSRFCLLACVAIARAAVWLVENPHSSKLFILPPFAWILKKPGLGNRAVRWWMGMYGSMSAKPQLACGTACFARIKSISFVFALIGSC